MTVPDCRDLLAVVDLDADMLARLLPNVADRDDRRRLRAVLAAAYQASLSLRVDTLPAAVPTPEDWRNLLMAAGLLADALQEVGLRGTGLRPIYQVRCRRPWRGGPRWPQAALLSACLVGQMDRRFCATVALTAKRLAWWQTRFEHSHPGLVLAVRAPGPSQERLNLELLSKKGRSPFS